MDQRDEKIEQLSRQVAALRKENMALRQRIDRQNRALGAKAEYHSPPPVNVG